MNDLNKMLLEEIERDDVEEVVLLTRSPRGVIVLFSHGNDPGRARRLALDGYSAMVSQQQKADEKTKA